MLSAIIFYTFLFLALIVVPAGLILIALLFLDHERRLWQNLAAVIAPLNTMLEQGFVLRLRQRFPRTSYLLARRLNTHNPWGLPATIAGFGIFIGLWFFLAACRT